MVGKEDLFSTDFVKGFANKLNMKDFDDNYVIKVIERKNNGRTRNYPAAMAMFTK